MLDQLESNISVPGVIYLDLGDNTLVIILLASERRIQLVERYLSGIRQLRGCSL